MPDTTELIQSNKRIIMTHDGSMIRIVNNNGSVTVRNAKSGIGYRVKNGVYICSDNAGPCKHEHTKLISVDRAAGNVEYCLDCGEYVDPNERPDEDEDDLNWDDIEEIPF